jgi:SAM-dependent methyltransferase
MDNIHYVGMDISSRQNINLVADITHLPLHTESFDAVICIHVLEEVKHDQMAMSELYRVLRSGSWAFITVPTRLDEATYEDSSITLPKDRERAFGEEAHVRIYGYDLKQRLETSGFRVSLDLNTDINPEIQERYGLLNDENIFFCQKD